MFRPRLNSMADRYWLRSDSCLTSDVSSCVFTSGKSMIRLAVGGDDKTKCISWRRSMASEVRICEMNSPIL